MVPQRNFIRVNVNDAFAVAFEDRSTNLWAALRGGSLLWFGGAEPLAAPITVPAKSGLAHCMKQDREGNLWVGTAEGLFQIRELLANTFVSTNDSGRQAYSISEGSPGSIWFSTDKTLACIRSNKLKDWPITNGNPRNTVHCFGL